jgi:isoquinoline 1-oxidoreductase beta subunit
MEALHNPQRRVFLKGAAAGTLVIAIAPALAAGATASAACVNGWVCIAPDGAVTILSNTSEIGQGTGTAIAQILADELDLDWRSVRIEMAPVQKQFFNAGWGEYATYGSGGVARQFEQLRKAGAQARAMLIAAAAENWKVGAAECDTELGFVVHKASGHRAAYATLAARAAAMPVPEKPALMPRERWRFMGKDIARLDLPSKVDGSAGFGVDVKVPGMLVAAILQCPNFGGKLKNVETAPALAMRGVVRVVQLANAVAVVADTYWRAKKGLDALAPVWDLAQASDHTSSAYNAALVAAVRAGGPVFAPRNSTAEKALADYDAAMAGATRTVQRVYTVPFLCHAPMEPMNATARVGKDSAELWMPTQAQSNSRDAVAKALGLASEAVTVHTTLSGGGFGRRIEYDFAVQAALIAREAGAPVKLIWSREEDMRHDFYRPAAAVRLTVGVDAAGMPVAFEQASACESLFDYSRNGEDRALAKPVDRSAVGEAPRHYKLGPLLFRVTTVDAGVPVGYWRSVATSQNAFAYESLVDELAHSAKVDPLVYRRRLLAPGSREQLTLNAACALAHWDAPPAAGRHRGLSLVHANGSTVAIVVELSVDGEQRVKLHRITCAIDCGLAVNPHNVRAQAEGSMVFGLSAAFYGEISLRDGAVEQANFHDYRLISMAELPPVHVEVVASQEAPGGAGEEAVGPLAPALANALFAATGKRIMALPLSKSGFTLV